MATFVRGQPITTREPTIKVDAGLAVGVHRFQLVVRTDTGQTSAPVVAEVAIQRTILDPTRPIVDTGVLTPTIPTRPRIDSTPVRPRAARSSIAISVGRRLCVSRSRATWSRSSSSRPERAAGPTAFLSTRTARS